MKTEAISTGAQPMPISAIAAVTIHGVVATAKTKAPPPPQTARSSAAVRFGPNRSSDTPTANCISAKATNHAPDAKESSALLAPSSSISAGVSTARKERKNCDST